MVAAAAARGYDLSAHRATQVTDSLIDWADLVLAMDATNLTALHALAPAARHATRSACTWAAGTSPTRTGGSRRPSPR
ncbi:hypothetical protein ACFWAR_00660 [Streptomyces sp. NPDC059917]|uniref:arsenate reductase/protein-tyrosine-phosphatase family protein n=1 Tax=Streptomyces sp. NPDC059917 TaxID=3347002 RepID=UPI00365DF518